MNHETTSSAAGEEDGGTAVLQPLPVSDELISRLAGKCEEIFPLGAVSGVMKSPMMKFMRWNPF